MPDRELREALERLCDEYERAPQGYASLRDFLLNHSLAICRAALSPATEEAGERRWPDGSTEPKRIDLCPKCGAEVDPDLNWGCEHVKSMQVIPIEVAVVPASDQGVERGRGRRWTLVAQVIGFRVAGISASGPELKQGEQVEVVEVIPAADNTPERSEGDNPKTVAEAAQAERLTRKEIEALLRRRPSGPLSEEEERGRAKLRSMLASPTRK